MQLIRNVTLILVCMLYLGVCNAYAAPTVNVGDYCRGTPATGSTSGACALAMSNSAANSMAICWVQTERTTTQGGPIATVTGITDNKGLTWSKHKSFSDNASLTNAFNNIEEWWATGLTAIDTGTGTTPTVTISSAADHFAFVCLAVSGMDAAQPWDINASMGSGTGAVASSIPTISGISTSSANTMVFGIATASNTTSCGTPTAGTGYTLIIQATGSTGGTNEACVAVEFQSFTSTQTGITVPFSNSVADWMMFTDAICSGCAAGGGAGLPRQGLLVGVGQ